MSKIFKKNKKKSVFKNAGISASKKAVSDIIANPVGYITGVIVGGKEKQEESPLGYIVGVIVGGKEKQVENPLGYIVGVIVGGKERQNVAGQVGVYNEDAGYIAGVIVGGKENQVARQGRVYNSSNEEVYIAGVVVGDEDGQEIKVTVG